MIQVKVTKLTSEAVIPKRQTEGSVGFDLSSIEDMTIKNTNVQPKAYLIHTGIALDIPKGYHGKIFLRSSTGLNTKLRLANGTGIIDSDYKGEIMLIIENNARQYQTIRKGERIAQILIEKDEDVTFVETTKAPRQTRHRGLGSTGKK